MFQRHSDWRLGNDCLNHSRGSRFIDRTRNCHFVVENFPPFCIPNTQKFWNTPYSKSNTTHFWAKANALSGKIRWAISCGSNTSNTAQDHIPSFHWPRNSIKIAIASLSTNMNTFIWNMTLVMYKSALPIFLTHLLLLDYSQLKWWRWLQLKSNVWPPSLLVVYCLERMSDKITDTVHENFIRIRASLKYSQLPQWNCCKCLRKSVAMGDACATMCIWSFCSIWTE